MNVNASRRLSKYQYGIRDAEEPCSSRSKDDFSRCRGESERATAKGRSKVGHSVMARSREAMPRLGAAEDAQTLPIRGLWTLERDGWLAFARDSPKPEIFFSPISDTLLSGCARTVEAFARFCLLKSFPPKR